jgi:hypothetical protein
MSEVCKLLVQHRSHKLVVRVVVFYICVKVVGLELLGVMIYTLSMNKYTCKTTCGWNW